ncbi:tyrosine-protein kinase-like otk [Varroa jacobsoni]|uniref:tyrosine-protein kinase-like otk n=1 Tax=Varroa jacobsoni TaxID=62625 RepID=UPI000BF87C56|nr:tyrosine-protein kinase-like otk [Varroa jacobsoni]
MGLGEAVVKLREPTARPEAGVDLVLTCDVDGNPEPHHIEWFRNGVRIHRGSHVSFRIPHVTLFNVSTKDNGVYSCKVANDVAVVSSSTHFVLDLQGPGVPSLKVRPLDVMVAEGSDAILDCAFDGAAMVEWYAHGHDTPLQNGSRMTIWPNNSLSIRTVAKKDEGMFQCVAIPRHRGVPQQVFAARLSVAWIGDFDQETSIEPPNSLSSSSSSYDLTYVTRLGGKLRLLCLPPDGIPTPRWYWTRPGGHVVSDKGRLRINSNSELELDDIRLEDAGNYTCHAENLAGKRSLVVNLIVTTPPEVHDHVTSTLRLHEGSSHIVQCSFRVAGAGWPHTQVVWTYLHAPTGRTPLDFDPREGDLTLANVTLNDAGSYACSVTSDGFPTVHSKPIVIEIIEKLKFFPVPVNKNLEFNTVSRIPCQARGAPSPKVKWTKIQYQTPSLRAEIKADESERNTAARAVASHEHKTLPLPTNLREENGVLIFDPVTYDDAGYYRCTATAGQDSINVTIEVTVGVAPRFILPPNDTDALEGHPTWLDCVVEGDPLPQVRWDRNSNFNILAHEHPRIEMLDNGTLYIHEVHVGDSGRYGCTAGNRGGFKRTEAKLTVKSSRDFVPQYTLSGDSGEETISRTISITLGAAGLYMALVLTLMLYCRVSRARRKAALLGSRSKGGGSIEEDGLDGGVTGGSGELPSNKLLPSAGSSETESVTSKNSKLSVERLHFPRKDLQTVMLLGRGDFGDVYLAKPNGIAEDMVMVKSLHSSEEASQSEFRRQTEMYSKLNHQGICRVVGMCAETEPLLVMYEHTDWGDLKQFLLATRKDTPAPQGNRPPALTTAQCMGICHQVALAMDYLSNHRFVHKDLATRNCLVTSKLDIKISSPSLSKDTYSSEYFHYRDQLVPLKWAPAEAVIEDQWSSKSDVYAYAVLCWEIFSQAQLPHEDISNPDFLYRLEVHDIKWEPPTRSPSAMKDLLRACWRISAKDRPTFSEVSSQVGQIFVDTNV